MASPLPSHFSIAWTSCSPDPLLWIQLREPLLEIVHTPWLLLPLLALLALAATVPFRLSWKQRALTAAALMLLASGIYTPFTTHALTVWLSAQLPASTTAQMPPTAQPSGDSAGPSPARSTRWMAVLVGRGPAIGAATTARAAQLVRDHAVEAVYVSGDALGTAELLVRQGVAPYLVSGDSCARTTWENATRTAAWLRLHHPGASVALITDQWQLPRAAQAFRQQGLMVRPIAAQPDLSPEERNRVALRETAAHLLYRLQGRTDPLRPIPVGSSF